MKEIRIQVNWACNFGHFVVNDLRYPLHRQIKNTEYKLYPLSLIAKANSSALFSKRS